MVCLRQIDDKTYRSQTSNYRNLSSHAIGPRLAIGQTNRVTRRVVIATRMELQSDGTGHVVEIPDRYVPSYGLGGLQPLDLEVARGSNLSQYVTSRECFAALMCLLKMQCAKLPQANV